MRQNSGNAPENSQYGGSDNSYNSYVLPHDLVAGGRSLTSAGRGASAAYGNAAGPAGYGVNAQNYSSRINDPNAIADFTQSLLDYHQRRQADSALGQFSSTNFPPQHAQVQGFGFSPHVQQQRFGSQRQELSTPYDATRGSSDFPSSGFGRDGLGSVDYVAIQDSMRQGGGNFSGEDDEDDDDDEVIAHGNEATGRWTREEHDLFLQALKKYGKVSAVTVLITGCDCDSRTDVDVSV